MDKRKEVLTLSKKLQSLLNKFSFDKTEEKTEEEFDTFPDGKAGQVKIDTFEMGAKVELVNEDGTLGIAPDGEYKHDATEQTYTVKAGVIDSIKEEIKAAEEVPVPDAWATQAAEFKTQLDAQAAAITALTEMITAMQTNMEAQATADEQMSAQFAAQFAELNSALKTIAQLPVEDSKINKNNTVSDSKEQKLKDIAMFLGSRK